ncbi:hypothetical protein LX15_003339 [Streptoalloteichus tenebrarius]|uniref:Metalloprotease n=1 Tax=Streptoalloteichus tenebrarius (strain ATCC 17920 / DSM 40477 / JCM 4838 / CBS 697.72 / NBRC 16177 / NCIMB 11028 / NRRL B-12390 / A12253. 1 / ISP 5477) TaxID=1933 RepID=A0ABT1HVT1_STRSD|nr:neutral zinc metallopeptidase [Streptoalloteichus tenebrarius]MCP2259634.1 hypothetical protein [Streptoalloteichus tenebrarius]
MHSPRKSNTGPLVAVALVLVAVVGVGFVGVAASFNSSTRLAEPGYDRYPTSSFTLSLTPSPTTTPAWPTTSEASAISTPTTTTTLSPTQRAERTGGGSTPRTGTQQTQTSKEPSKPRPVLKLADNPLHNPNLGVPKTNCSLPRWNADPGAQHTYYMAVVECLARAWDPVLAAAGLPTGAPRVFTPTSPFNSPCGNNMPPTTNAFYCQGNIYMTPLYFAQVEQRATDKPDSYLGTLSHEYGHHIQELSGVLAAESRLAYDHGVGSPAALELSRRRELQANCLGGMFFAGVVGNGSVSRATYEGTLRDRSHRGDSPRNGPRDHGNSQNNGAWFQQGAEKNRTSQCNTWAAPADAVS